MLLERQSYLGSYGNIRDIKNIMRELEEKRSGGLITEREYEAEKKRVLREM